MNISRITRILNILTILMATVGMTACHTEYEEEMSRGEAYVSLTLKLPYAATRAVPQGGEEGDGREDGTDAENKVTDAWIYILRHPAGMDAPDNTPLLYTKWFNDADTEEWTTLGDGVEIKFSIDGYDIRDGDRVIAVCNAGASLPKPANLGELRNQTAYAAWNRADGTRFVVSSAYNDPDEGKIITTSNAGTKEDPFVSSLQIQRTAARIDLMYNHTENLSSSGTELIYKVYANPDNTASTVLAKMHLQNIIPVNLMQQSSYMIKRVTSDADITSTVRYGAKERTAADGTPVNYVVEPHTLEKTGSVNDGQLDDWYGNTRAQKVYTNPTSYLSATGIASYSGTETAKTGLGDNFTHIMTLAYTNENTQDKDHQSTDFITGLLLRAVYEPAKVYTDKDCTTEYTPMTDYATGHTFWRYCPTRTEMREADCLYFSNQAAAEGYRAAHPSDMAEITEFTDGVCYYNVWLRHANIDSDPHLPFPMEYGIVRNNIYRVGLSKVTGPGTPTPDLKAPDHLYLRIFVREWNLRKQPTIRL